MVYLFRHDPVATLNVPSHVPDALQTSRDECLAPQLLYYYSTMTFQISQVNFLRALDRTDITLTDRDRLSITRKK